MESNLRSYFSHDSNARNSTKLLNLRMKHGAAGYGAFFMILERLREEKEYMSIKDYNMIAFDLRVDASLIKSVIEDFGLFVFTEDGKYFYSESFSRRMGIKDDISKKRSEAGKRGMAKRYGNEIADTVSVEEESITKEQICYNKNKLCYNKKSKEKKSKENTPPHTPPHGEVSSSQSMEEEISFENSFFHIRDAQTLSTAVMTMGGTDDYCKDILRMSCQGDPHSPIWDLLDDMRRSHGRITMTDTIRAMAEYERRGLLNCPSAERVHIEQLLRETVKPEEAESIISALTFPAREKRCIQAVEEIRKSNGKIRQPAKFILSELNKVPAV